MSVMSLDEILLKEEEEAIFEDCIDALNDTPLDRLNGIPDLNDMIENLDKEGVHNG